MGTGPSGSSYSRIVVEPSARSQWKAVESPGSCWRKCPFRVITTESIFWLTFGKGEPTARPGIIHITCQGSTDLCAAQMLRNPSRLGLWPEDVDIPALIQQGCKCFLQGSLCQLAWQVKKKQNGDIKAAGDGHQKRRWCCGERWATCLLRRGLLLCPCKYWLNLTSTIYFYFLRI